MKLGIDVMTKDEKKLVARLAALKTTVTVESGGMYGEDSNYSQVWLETSLTETEVEDWLYNQSGIDYVGVFGREA